MAILSRAVVGSLVVASALVARPARAELCPTDDAPLVAHLDAAERLAFLDAAFEREVREVDIWSWTWGSAYAAIAAGQAVAIPLTGTAAARVDLRVGIISAAVGSATLYGLPLKLTLPLRAARAHATDPDRCAALARAERTLDSVASNQALATGVFGHVGNVLVNTGILLILGVGFGQWTPAAISFSVGVSLGEANAFTQPHHLRDVMMQYRLGQLGAAPPRETRVAWAIVPLAAPRMTGAAIAGSW
jgi:hypothetical protein